MTIFLHQQRYSVFKTLATWNESKSANTVRERLEIACTNQNPHGNARFITPDVLALVRSSPNQPMTRAKLATYVSSRTTTTLQAVFAIFGWGGIGSAKFQQFLSKGDDGTNALVKVLDHIRSSRLDRKDAYACIKDGLKGGGKTSEWRLYGVGPAYYTKLIFFFTRRSARPGYIMDQWSARSMNYLCGRPDIKLTREGSVHDGNAADVYELYCRRIEALASDLQTLKPGITPSKVEMALYNKGYWREHVRANDVPGLFKKMQKAERASHAGRTQRAVSQSNSRQSDKQP